MLFDMWRITRCLLWSNTVDIYSYHLFTFYNLVAPEVIELKGASPASDIWSLGCTVIEMLTGQPPYAELLPLTTLFRIVEDERPPLPSNLSMDLLDFLCQCFQKDPSLRPSAGALGRHIWIKRNFTSRVSPLNKDACINCL